MVRHFVSERTTRDSRRWARTDLPDLCSIYAPPASVAANKGEDGSVAAYPNDWTLIAQSVACHLDAALGRSEEGQAAGRLRSVGDWTVRITAGQVWRASTVYALGVIVRPTVETGRMYVVTVAGTSGASEPSWPTGLHGTAINGSVTFTEFSILSPYRIRMTTKANRDFEVIKSMEGSNPITVPIECKEV